MNAAVVSSIVFVSLVLLYLPYAPRPGRTAVASLALCVIAHRRRAFPATSICWRPTL
jgi:hypothetical protein